MHTSGNVYLYKHIVVSLLYTDMVKLNTETSRDWPYSFLQMFLLAAGQFWDVSREHSCRFCPDYILAAPFVLLSAHSSSLFIPVIPLEVSL